MNVLVIGCGSIGRRHAKNLKMIGHEVIVCDINKKHVSRFAKENRFRHYTDYLIAIENERIDCAIIATPSNFHTKPAKDLANAGINIFMEKPLATTLVCIDELEAIVKDKKIVFMMGQSYRFHEGLLCMKKLIDQKVAGDIYSVEMFGGWYLPDWHYKEDYRQEYAARTELGGGVLLTSLSHSIDTARWIFGEIIDFKIWKGKLSNLELDVDDYVSGTLLTENKVVINIIDDFICRLPRNEIRLFGSKGFIVSVFSQNEIHYWNVSGKRFLPDDPNLDPEYNYTKVLEDGINYDSRMNVECFNFDINKRYIDEMIFFINKVEKHETNFHPNLFDGIRVLEILTSDNIKAI